MFTSDPDLEVVPGPPLPPEVAENLKVYYTSSSDNGETWSEPVVVGFGEKPAIELEGNGIKIFQRMQEFF